MGFVVVPAEAPGCVLGGRGGLTYHTLWYRRAREEVQSDHRPIVIVHLHSCQWAEGLRWLLHGWRRTPVVPCGCRLRIGAAVPVRRRPKRADPSPFCLPRCVPFPGSLAASRPPPLAFADTAATLTCAIEQP